jgi:two-component system sensor histidine kinase/response regulator
VLELVALRHFDLILMDIQMPEMDGLQATAEIRNREGQRGKHIPIVAMTAHAMAGDRERCLDSGMDGYIAKPIHPGELMALITGISAQRVAAVSVQGAA